MGADLALPLFNISLSHPDLRLLLESILDTHPELSENVEGWRILSHVLPLEGSKLAVQVEALDAALTAGGFEKVDTFNTIAARVRWLKHDLTVAPISISQRIPYGGNRLHNESHFEPIVVGPGVEWFSIRYLLGVLLGELHRLEGLPLEAASEIDQAGVLDLTTVDLPWAAVVRTVDAIVFADKGRHFGPSRASDPPRIQPITEVDQFSDLQQLLASHSRPG